MGDQLVARIEKAANKKAIATSQGLVAALTTLHAKRVVMLTPYPQPVNDAEVRFLNHFGFDVLHEVGLNLPPTISTASVTPEQWLEKAVAMKRPDADAYFLSCTNIRVLTIIEELELPEESKAALSREALKQGIPVNQLVKQVLLKTADRILRAAGNNQPTEVAA
jgi:maleate isomerase